MLKRFFCISGFKLSLVVTTTFAFLFMSNYLGVGTVSFLNLMDKKIVDFIIRTRGDALPQTDIAIVAIDTKSVDKFGRWPWGRNIMADLLEELQNYYQVSVVGYDVVFSEKDPNDVTSEKVLKTIESLSKKEFKNTRILQNKLKKIYSNVSSQMQYDQRFGASLSKYSNVVLGYFFFPTDERIKHLNEKEILKSAEGIKDSEITIVQGKDEFLDTVPIYQMKAVESNIPELVSGSSLSGYFNMFPDDEDGTVRRVHLVLQYQDKYYPSLGLQMLRRYYGNPPIQLIVNEAGVEAIVLGNKRINTASDGSLMINYRGDRETFAHYSVFDIINRNIPKEELKDKVILLGATEVGIFDLRITPVGIDYPGVEVHANVLDNIIKDDYLYNSDLVDILTFLLIIIFGLVVGVILPKLSALPGFIFTSILLFGYTAINLWFFYNERAWGSFVYILGVITINWFAIILLRFFGEEKDKRFIKNAFKQYLSPTVIDQLVDDPAMLKLGGEKRVMTAFFSDIQGFSTISESLSPEELVELLNEYLTAMTDIILKYGGTVDKFEGDAIIAFFGAPVAQPDHALQACLASLEMQEKVAEMRKEWKKQGKHEIHVRIGLNTGEMVVGNMGSAYRMDYTMMGDAVNLAARLEGVNKEYKTFLMFSDYTYQEVKSLIEVRELDLIRVVGKNEPVKIYQVLGKRGEVENEKLQLYKYFAKGLRLYREKNWAEALKYFAYVDKSEQNGDGPAQTFIQRCKFFSKSPLEEDWDGVFQMRSK